MKDDSQIQINAERDGDPRNELAVESTELALERTHLAWIRTVVGLITAGFAIDKVFMALHEARVASGEAWVNNGHLAGIVLIGTGILLLVITTLYYIRRMKQLNQMRGAKKNPLAPGVILSVLIFLIGSLLLYFVSVT